jgi:hypothetical protein
VKAYEVMKEHPSTQKPLAWTSADFTLEPYNLIFFPGGHEKGVRQVIDSPIIHKHVASYFPQTLRSSPNNASSDVSAKKAVGAVCHGVMVLSSSKYTDNAAVEVKGRSVLYDANTTALPAKFEDAAFWGTRLFLGDYYKTYGAGSEDVQESVTKVLDNPKQFKNSIGLSPFVVEDPKYRYVSGRWPGDAELLAKKLVVLVKSS